MYVALFSTDKYKTQSIKQVPWVISSK